MASDAKRELLHFLEEKALEAVLAKPDNCPESKRTQLEKLQMPHPLLQPPAGSQPRLDRIFASCVPRPTTLQWRSPG